MTNRPDRAINRPPIALIAQNVGSFCVSVQIVFVFSPLSLNLDHVAVFAVLHPFDIFFYHVVAAAVFVSSQSLF